MQLDKCLKIIYVILLNGPEQGWKQFAVIVSRAPELDTRKFQIPGEQFAYNNV
jgi:hypothetical protein